VTSQDKKTLNNEAAAPAAHELLEELKTRGLIADPQSAEEIALAMGISAPQARAAISGGAGEAAEDARFAPATISENAGVVLERRYLRKNDQGEVVEDSEGLFRRVAGAMAEVDRKYGRSDEEVAAAAEQFYRVMASLEYLPNSPTLMNAGTGAGTLSACFVLPLEDSMEGIMRAAHDAAMVQKFGGGTGFALSGIRPKGSPIRTTHGRACGPVAVLRHLSSVSTLVTQGGKRDGANMAVMDVHHPDILEFIDSKKVEGEIHNFNISVGVSDEFMRAVEEGTDYPLRTKADPADPDSAMVEVERLDARHVFQKIVDGAWRNGEPGMVFLDVVNRDNPVDHVGRITATNPCGEQPLLPNESCNLGSIDVSRFVVDARDGRRIDYDRLAGTVRLAVHFLDNVIDANGYAVPAIKEASILTRKIGLGIMGFADMLVRLGIRYDSEEGVETGRRLMRFIRKEADRASETLAAERGPYPAWEGSRPQREGAEPIRNACRLTVAPTGTVSMIAGCSSGIEPLFALAYRKQHILGGETLYYVDANFEEAARERGFHDDELMEYLADGGSLQDRSDVPDDVKEVFRTALDIAPEFHVRMQAAFQESVDAAISKTINFRNEAPAEDVETAYMLAWQLGCKGITVYRSGSREQEVLARGGEGAEAGADGLVAQYVTPRARPAEITGITRRVRTGHGNMYVTINVDRGGRPFELFALLGKAGGCDAAQMEATTRLVSLALRSGIDPEEIVRQMKGITCCPVWDDGELVRSCPDAIALTLDRQIRQAPAPDAGELDERETGQLGMFGRPSSGELGLPTATPVAELEPADRALIGRGTRLCPECQSTLAHEEGCLKCHVCGYSQC